MYLKRKILLSLTFVKNIIFTEILILIVEKEINMIWFTWYTSREESFAEEIFVEFIFANLPRTRKIWTFNLRKLIPPKFLLLRYICESIWAKQKYTYNFAWKRSYYTEESRKKINLSALNTYIWFHFFFPLNCGFIAIKTACKLEIMVSF